jgi:putative membrane protein
MPARLALALLFPLLAACAQSGGTASGGATAQPQDAKLLESIAQADMAEIAAGRLAAQKGESPAVRQYGQHMIDEHSRTLADGAGIAAAKGTQLPGSPEPKHQAALRQLESLSGAAFDRAYMQQMVRDHQQTLRLLQHAAASSDPQVRAHAQKALPHVQQHLQIAQRLAGELQARSRY